jgi:hypothetical protein
MRRDVTFDCEREAEAAMKMAAASSGAERMKWVRAALAWHDLARDKSAGKGSESTSRAFDLFRYGKVEA